MRPRSRLLSLFDVKFSGCFFCDSIPNDGKGKKKMAGIKKKLCITRPTHLIHISTDPICKMKEPKISTDGILYVK